MNTCLVACTSRFEFYAKLVTGRWLHGNLGRLHLRAGLSHCFQEQPGMKRESCMSPIRQCLGSYKGQSLFAKAYNRFWEAASKMHELRGELFNCASTLCAYCCEPKMLGCCWLLHICFPSVFRNSASKQPRFRKFGPEGSREHAAAKGHVDEFQHLLVRLISCLSEKSLKTSLANGALAQRDYFDFLRFAVLLLLS